MTDPQDALVSMLCEDNRRMREAGCSLAMAALHVIRDADGLHRLALAVSAWADAMAKEGGRPHGNDVGHKGCCWKATCGLRVMHRSAGDLEGFLQQAWQCLETGEVEWRDIPHVRYNTRNQPGKPR